MADARVADLVGEAEVLAADTTTLDGLPYLPYVEHTHFNVFTCPHGHSTLLPREARRDSSVLAPRHAAAQ